MTMQPDRSTVGDRGHSIAGLVNGLGVQDVMCGVEDERRPALGSGLWPPAPVDDAISRERRVRHEKDA